MASIKTQEEKMAVCRKLDYPNEDVKCPTCNVLLKFEQIEHSGVARCPKCGITGAARGI